MRCDEARPVLSAAMDGLAGPAERAALEEHLRACQACAADHARLAEVRRLLRFEVLDEIPDLAPATLAAVRSGDPRARPKRPSWLPVAASFVLAFVLGAVVVGLRTPAEVMAADLADRVLAEQSRVWALDAELSLVERGWHPQIPERRWEGHLRYRSPETAWLRLEDRTAYPSPRWVANDVDVVVAEDRAWTRGPAPCPTAALPECAPAGPRTRALVNRQPFGEELPVPLDLVLPVRSFRHAAEPRFLGTRTVGGRRAIGVEVPASQIEPLLDGMRAAGQWREIHPGDRTELWLDAEALVPMAFDVFPSNDPDRALWAASRGYDDPSTVPLLSLAVTQLALNEDASPWEIPATPSDAVVRDAGFRDRARPALVPAWVPEGMEPHRAGWLGGDSSPRVDVAAWSDGRAWVRVSATTEWPGGRLFGDLGPLVRAVDLGDGGDGGVAYANEAGTRIAVHGDGIEAVVSGTLDEAALRRIASSLGVVGRAMPSSWAEAPTVSLPSVSGEALVPRDLAGYGVPAVRDRSGVLQLAYAGPGARGFLLTQQRGTRLTPPLEADVRGVEVRGLPGRYAPRSGELEWVESGRVVSLRSATLTLPELLVVASSLR